MLLTATWTTLAVALVIALVACIFLKFGKTIVSVIFWILAIGCLIVYGMPWLRAHGL